MQAIRELGGLMRVLAITVLASGCVISSPEGALQFWPPALGVAVEAVIAADLDADGATDIVVFGSGNASQAGMYHLQGRTDLVLGSGNVVRSFTRFVPADFTRPLAAHVSGDAVPSILVADSATHLRVTRLTSTLEVAESGESTIDGGGSIVWTMPMTFPSGMPHYAVSDGTFIDHLSPVFSDPRPLPAPGTPTWDRAELVTSYTEGDDRVAVVATRDGIERAVIPRMPGIFAWETVRAGGPAWFGQTSYDFDGDGRDEIVGFDLAGNRVCVVDPGLTPPMEPSCIELSSTFPGGDVTLIVGTNLTMSIGLDMLVAQASGTATNYTLFEDVTYTTARTLEAARAPRPLPVAGPPRGRTVIATEAPGMPFVVVTFGTEGAVACVLGPC